MVAVLAVGAAPPAPADPCAYVTGGQAFFVTPSTGQQVTTHVGGGAVAFQLQVRLSNGQTKDVTRDGNTHYFTNGAGNFGSNFANTQGLYGPEPPDVNKTFPIYLRYTDPCKNVTWTFTVSLHVIP